MTSVQRTGVASPDEARSFVQRMQNWVDRGFCLHGSRVPGLAIIEPRQAVDLNGHPAKSLRAVYAHRQDVRIPLVKASGGPLRPSEAWSLDYTTHPSGHLTVRGLNLSFGTGIIYVLPTSGFRSIAQEFLAFAPVAPVAVETIPFGAVPAMPDTTIIDLETAGDVA